MRLLAYLFLSVAAGFGVYSLGAIAWSMIDPHGAGETLHFTIPIALGGMAIPGILGMLCLVFHCDFIPTPRPARRQASRTQVLTPAMPHLIKPAHLPAPPPPPRRSKPRPTPPPALSEDDIELALAS